MQKIEAIFIACAIAAIFIACAILRMFCFKISDKEQEMKKQRNLCTTKMELYWKTRESKKQKIFKMKREIMRLFENISEKKTETENRRALMQLIEKISKWETETESRSKEQNQQLFLVMDQESFMYDALQHMSIRRKIFKCFVADCFFARSPLSKILDFQNVLESKVARFQEENEKFFEEKFEAIKLLLVSSTNLPVTNLCITIANECT